MQVRRRITLGIAGWLLRRRAVQGLILAAALVAQRVVRRMMGTSRYTTAFDFQSPPRLDMLDRLVRDLGTGSRRAPGADPGAPGDEANAGGAAQGDELIQINDQAEQPE